MERHVKFCTPVATRVVDRPRLHARLTDGLRGGTVLVAATAGWGKTLLAASWIDAGADGRTVAWVSLDRADDDERAFWPTVATALLAVADDEPARDGLRRLTAAGGVDHPSLFADAVRRLSRRYVLVLDNLHEIRSPEVHAGLLQFVERPLPALALVATTRRDPPWPLERLRLAGVLAEVRAADLAFRPDEAAALFANLGLGLSAPQVHMLVDRTEGWVAGLRLAALHLLACADADDVDTAVRSFSGDDHSVAGYLLTEVLDRQAPALVAFLEHVSVVDAVNAGLADALTGGDDGAARLAELSTSLLFVEAVGIPGRWYRLHRMIADILRARPTPARRRRDLHRRAAEWFRDHDMPIDAIAAALQARLWSLAADLVGRHVVTLALHGDAHRLERILAELPRAVVLDRPELAAGLAGVRVVQGRVTEVRGLVDAARAGAPLLGGPREQRLCVLLDMIDGAVARITGDVDAALAAYRRVPRDAAMLSRLGISGASVVPVVVLNNIGTAELWRGQLTAAAAHLTAAQVATDGFAPDGPTLAHLNATAHLALLHGERGELDAARACAREATAMATARGWSVTPQAVAAALTMCWVLLDRDEPADLDRWLQRVAEVQSVAPEQHIELAAAIVLAARREAAGDLERALTGLRATSQQLEPWTPPRGLAEQWMLAEATLRARLGDAAGARTLLSKLGSPRTAGGAVAVARLHLLVGEAAGVPEVPPAHPRARVGAHLVETLAAAAAGEPDGALRALEHALQEAAPGRLRRPFLVEAAALRPLLRRRIEEGTAVPGFALDLVQRMSGGPADETSARRARPDPLTEREQTVLRYLASSLSNAEIANELYVSINTVKTHQRSVYRKLGAAGRRDAVRRARVSGLL